MPQNWLIDPASGDYVLENGKPVETDSLQVPAYFRLKTPRGKWLYAPDDKYGSTFYTLKKQQSQDASAVERVAENAVQPILDDGRARQAIVETNVSARNEVVLTTTLQQENGTLDTLILPKLGA